MKNLNTAPLYRQPGPAEPEAAAVPEQPQYENQKQKESMSLLQKEAFEAALEDPEIRKEAEKTRMGDIMPTKAAGEAARAIADAIDKSVRVDEKQREAELNHEPSSILEQKMERRMNRFS